MKKLLFRILSAFSFSMFMFTSCDDPIFTSIRDEVELEDADVSGAIYSMARYGDYIYVQNGKIYRKKIPSSGEKITAHDWDEVKRPSGISADYAYVNKVVADANHLYAQITKIDEDEEEGENISKGCEIWCYTDDGADGVWERVEFNGWGSYATSFRKSDVVNLFATDSEDPSKRRAFVNVNWCGWILDGNSASKYVPASGATAAAGDGSTAAAGDEISTGNLYFGNCYSMISTTDNEFFYVSDSGTVRYGTKDQLSGLPKNAVTQKPDYSQLDGLNVGYLIYSIALTNDVLLVGTNSGLRMFELDNRIPISTGISFKNTSSTLSSYYRVHTVFTLDSSKPLEESNVYASADYSGSSSNTSASAKNRGLWSYLGTDNVRRSWNRE